MMTPPDGIDEVRDRQALDMQEELERLQKLVYYDELTGLHNRRGFMEEAARLFHLVSYGNTSLERRTGFQIPFSIVYVDLDHFKEVNDTYGHSAGDCVLREFSRVMQESLRLGDLCARIGGEEFAVAIIGASAKRGLIIAEKLRLALLAHPITCEDRKIPVTASFGVAEYSDEKALEELMEKADRAMYQAKREGRNRAVMSLE